MAINDTQRSRIAGAVQNLRRNPAWQVLRRFCVAESAEDAPDFEGVKAAICAELERAVDADIQAGIENRKEIKP